MFNDCLPKFITPKTSFLAGLFAVEPMGQRKGNCFSYHSSAGALQRQPRTPNLIESIVTQRQRLLTELNVKVKGGKFLKTTMVLLQWRV